ncbi:DUF305 domain-containing protein [Pseudanabaena biceps]|nr:DUF305 domain-containing protein [Pseudanabaena biceps]
MKSTEPEDSTLELPQKSINDRQRNKLRSLRIASIAIGGAIALTGVLPNLVQAQTMKPPSRPFAAGACPSDTNAAMKPNQGMQHGMMGGGMMNGEVADRHFIEMMIPHHDGAVKMADLALQKSKNPEVRTLAEAIKHDQTLEITQMRDWYKQWYKADVPAMAMTNPLASSRPMPNHSMMGMNGGKMGMGNMMASDLSMLETAKDGEFDKLFVAQMIPHHKMALMMSNMIVDSDRPELRKLARDILRSQSQEIEQMRVIK